MAQLLSACAWLVTKQTTDSARKAGGGCDRQLGLPATWVTGEVA